MTNTTRRPLSRRTTLSLLALLPVSLASACAETTTDATADATEAALPHLTVHKDPTCGCCGGWITYMEGEGFGTTTKHPESLAAVFEEHEVPLEQQSCHLAETAAGAIFVGHVPARFVREYLADPPAGSRGLTVPAMPVGTPGMEQGDQFDPYEVLLLTDGEPEVFARVEEAADQA